MVSVSHSPGTAVIAAPQSAGHEATTVRQALVMAEVEVEVQQARHCKRGGIELQQARVRPLADANATLRRKCPPYWRVLLASRAPALQSE
jgi:hypothetical protein